MELWGVGGTQRTRPLGRVWAGLWVVGGAAELGGALSCGRGQGDGRA